MKGLTPSFWLEWSEQLRWWIKALLKSWFVKNKTLNQTKANVPKWKFRLNFYKNYKQNKIARKRFMECGTWGKREQNWEDTLSGSFEGRRPLIFKDWGEQWVSGYIHECRVEN